MRYVLIASGAIGDVGRPDFVGVFAERYLSFKSTFERALSARAYFGFFKIAAHCPTPCSCTPASNAAFSASVHLRLPCLCACGLKTTDFANGDNGGVSPGLCALVFVGVVDARHLSFKSTFERAASARPNSGSFKIMLQRPTKSSSARAVRVSPPSPTLAPRLPLALALASSSRPVPVPYFPTPSASASFSSSVQNAFFLRVLFLLFCAFGRPVARVVSHSFAILRRRRPLLGVFRRGPRSFSRTVVCRADTVCMSTSASFRAFIPALTFFFAIVVRVGESAPRGASSSSRIRARRAMVPLAMARSTTSIRNDRRRVDRYENRSTTRRFIFRRREHRSTDRPTATHSIRSNSIVDRRRDGATRRRRLTSRRSTTTIERATRSRRTRRERTRGDDDDDDDDDAFGGNHRTRAGDGCARATTARDARARRATRGGRDGARDAVATRARGRERVRWFDAGEAGARIASASIRLDGSDADAAGRTRRRDDGKGARVR